MSNTAVLENALLPLRPLLDREDVTEVVINRPREAAIEAVVEGTRAVAAAYKGSL